MFEFILGMLVIYLWGAFIQYLGFSNYLKRNNQVASFGEKLFVALFWIMNPWVTD